MHAPGPRVLVVAAHPNDETIGAGGLLGRLQGCVVAILTDGAPRDLGVARAAGYPTREAFARERRRELERAMALVGIGPSQVRSLGTIDQEAMLELPGLTRKLVALLEEACPEAILFPSYEGGHPDHDAAAFVVHSAVRLLPRIGPTPPVLVEMAVHHDEEVVPELPTFLEPLGCEATSVLDERDKVRKRRMLSCFRSQQLVLRGVQADHELFRAAPARDFAALPHPGPLHYERHGHAVTGEAFRSQARRALERLGLAANL
ncbi:MAG: PIG-L family deacetylase [Deltaproteobacteria bacterium]|nr:PIG-L family deacetylase [Deltaproteobacteria bacterium]